MASKRRLRQNLPRSFSLQQHQLLVPLLFLLLLLLGVVVVSMAIEILSWSAFFHHNSFSIPPQTPSYTLVAGNSNTKSLQAQTNLSTSLLDSIRSPVNAAPTQAIRTITQPSTSKAKADAAGNDISMELQNSDVISCPYNNWQLFSADFGEMLNNLKIFVYPDVAIDSSPFARIFLPHPNPFNPKLGNYFSEHMFKVALLKSSLVTSNPDEAHLFFMPFSINALRNDPRIHSEAAIADFVVQYTTRISREFPFWNATRGSDHFYVCCHSVGRDVASKHLDLQTNAIQVTCSSSYFQRLYVTHKDVGLPQVWPRPPDKALTPPDARIRLVFFAGRMQNSRVRQELIEMWKNDTSMDIFPGSPPFPYEEGFRRSKYCLHIKGYEVNTGRISDSLHYGCIPVIISNHYDLPFSNVLDWSKFSVIISHGDIALLKQILLSISREMYLSMYQNLCLVRRHFKWHTTPRGYDSFHMTAYQLWMRRGMQHLSY